jgi:predicted lipid-binding transport protein (Tim44 family)
MTGFTLLAGDPRGAGLAANNFGDTLSGGLAGPMGLLIILLLAIGTVLLIRNMNSHLRRLPANFPADDATVDPADTAEPTPTDRPTTMDRPTAPDGPAGTDRPPAG